MITTSKNNSSEAATTNPIQEAKDKLEQVFLSINNVDNKTENNKNAVSGERERTLALISYTDNLEDIINHIEKDGFIIVKTKTIQFNLEQAREFYAEHATQSYHDKMVKWLSSGSNICALILEKENAVKDWRFLMGPTNYKKARKSNPNSIRALFGGKDASQNATHGSDSDASAKKEIDFIFGDDASIYAAEPHKQLQNDVDMQEEKMNDEFIKSSPENQQNHNNNANNTEKVKEKEVELLVDNNIVEKENVSSSVKNNDDIKAECNNKDAEASTVVGEVHHAPESTAIVEEKDKEKDAAVLDKVDNEHEKSQQAETKDATKATPLVSKEKECPTSHEPETAHRKNNMTSASEAETNNKPEKMDVTPDANSRIEEAKETIIETPMEKESNQGTPVEAAKFTELNNVTKDIQKVERDIKDAHSERSTEETQMSTDSKVAESNKEDAEPEKVIKNAHLEKKAEEVPVRNEAKDVQVEKDTEDAQVESNDSVTATPSSESSENVLTATTSTDVNNEEDNKIVEDTAANKEEKDSVEKDAPVKEEKVAEGEIKKENGTPVEKKLQKKSITDVKASRDATAKKTNGTKEIKKETATTPISRIRPPNVKKGQNDNMIRNTTATTTTGTTRPASTANKTSTPGTTTRIARLSPSATMNKESGADKKKTVSGNTRENGVPSIAKKTVTKVSKHLPRVATLAAPKTATSVPKKEEEEAVEKKTKKRVTSTRSFISRLTAPTVASANKKAEADVQAASNGTTTSKRSSLPSKRSSIVRPTVSSSKDIATRNKQKKENVVSKERDQEQSAGGLATINTNEEAVDKDTSEQQPEALSI